MKNSAQFAPLNFLPPELVDSGITGQYHLGPTSQGFASRIPIALAFRNIYTYKTIGDDESTINWGVKRSYFKRDSEEFGLCGIRIFSNIPQIEYNGASFAFWRSNFARFVETSPSSYTLYYQFSILEHKSSTMSPSQEVLADAIYDKWKAILGCQSAEPASSFGSATDWIESKEFKKREKYFYRYLYHSSFQEDMEILSNVADSERIFGMVQLNIGVNESGEIQRPTEGKFHSFLPVSITGRQQYENLVSPEMQRIKHAGGPTGFRKHFFDYESHYGTMKAPEDCAVHLRLSPKSESLKTCNPRFHADIEDARKQMEGFFKKEAEQRPLNCLILGSPGSGKTFIAKLIGESLFAKSKINKTCFIRTFNLSHASTSSDIDDVFIKIADDEEKKEYAGLGRIYFFDEFDVTVTGTSIIRYLIDFVYEGNYEGRKFGRVAFIFSGGALENRNTIYQLRENASDFDLPRFLFDCYAHTGDDEVSAAASDGLLVMSRMEDLKLAKDRGISPLKHLSGLEKLRDFLSRINGFILEIPDISDPLSVTKDRNLVSYHASPIQGGLNSLLTRSEMMPTPGLGRNRQGLALLDFILTLEGKFPEIFKFKKSDAEMRFPFLVTKSNVATHVLEYKNMLLCERYFRSCLDIVSHHTSFLTKLVETSVRVFIDKEHMNFLCSVPLVHGSRSLNYICSKLECFDERNMKVRPEKKNFDKLRFQRVYLRLPKEIFYQETFRMHVGDCSYSDIGRWWRQMFSENPLQLEHIGPFQLDSSNGESMLILG